MKSLLKETDASKLTYKRFTLRSCCEKKGVQGAAALPEFKTQLPCTGMYRKIQVEPLPKSPPKKQLGGE